MANIVICTGDFHTHSEYSHGRGDLKGNIEMAIKKGLKELAITDHGPRTWNIIRLGVKNAEQLLVISKKIKKLQSDFQQIKLKAGVEANIINEKGDIDVPAYILEQLDIVAVGFHLLMWPVNFRAAKDIIIDNRIIYKYFTDRRKEIRCRNTEIIINAVQRNNIDFITHPGYGVDIDTYQLARVCAEEGTYLEINSRHTDLIKGFVRAAAETDVKFIINSDAHSPEQVGELEEGLKMVAELGLNPERVVNLKL